jgi:hypothetical protein
MGETGCDIWGKGGVRRGGGDLLHGVLIESLPLDLDEAHLLERGGLEHRRLNNKNAGDIYREMGCGVWEEWASERRTPASLEAARPATAGLPATHGGGRRSVARG